MKGKDRLEWHHSRMFEAALEGFDREGTRNSNGLSVSMNSVTIINVTDNTIHKLNQQI